MAFLLLGLHCEVWTSKVSFLMERANSHDDDDAHVIDIDSAGGAFSSILSHERPSSNLEEQHREDQPSTSSRVPVYQPPLLSNSRNSSLNRRDDNRSRSRRPLNSPLWISMELVLTVSQIIASIVVLSSSRNEKPSAPLKAWIIGYASGCVAIVPLLFWRLRYRNRDSEHVNHENQDSARGSHNGGPLSGRVTGGEDHQTTATADTPSNGLLFLRLKGLVKYSRIALDCFFAIWFVVGNVWVFGGHSSAAEAPHVYRLCIAFLTISCIGYAMPFILCTAICCCLPCIISLGLREDLSENSVATQDSINSLPTYKFKVKKRKNGKDKENQSGAGEGGIVAAGTAKERAISAEDAVCCICLARYVNNDELRELPCSHLHHKECVDKWLKINASCPLCKADVGQTALSLLPQRPASM